MKSASPKMRGEMGAILGGCEGPKTCSMVWTGSGTGTLFGS
jgi:hypothetical protein